MKGFFVVFLTVLILTWLATRATHEKAYAVDHVWIFPAVSALRWIYSAALAIGAGISFLGMRGPHSARTATVLGGLLFTSFALLTWPKAVYASQEGLRQRTWFGGWRNIGWSQISAIDEPRDRSVVVRSAAGNIVFSAYHADPERFLREISKHFKFTAKHSSQSG